MTSEVTICNQALSLVGASLITSLDDDTNEAKLCKVHYETARDAVLESYAWSFATQWRQLPKSADPPLGEFANEYPIPPDVLSVLFVGEDYDHPYEWQLEDNAIRSDSSDGKCQVLYRVADVSKFSSMFIQALVAKLASELAIPVTNSRTLFENMMMLYEQRMSQAMAKDGQQGTARRIRSKWLTGARYRGGYRAGPYV